MSCGGPLILLTVQPPGSGTQARWSGQWALRSALRGLGSDNLIFGSEVTATEAARSFADLLDAVEHRGERFTIVRRGKAIASLEPMNEGHGADVKALLRRHRPDSEWSKDVAAIRSVVEIEERP
jgi:prevent-host-death family protein